MTRRRPTVPGDPGSAPGRLAVRLGPLALAGAVALGAVAGCGGDEGGRVADEAVSTSSTTVPLSPPESVIRTDVQRPADGELRIVLGRQIDLVLPVVSCERDPDAEPVDQVPVALLDIRAEGRDAEDRPVVVDVTRFRSTGAATTITDTVTVLVGTEDDPVTALVAQRFELNGLVTDGRDPDATSPLLLLSASEVRADGLFAAPGDFADDGGRVEGIVRAACPEPDRPAPG